MAKSNQPKPWIWIIISIALIAALDGDGELFAAHTATPPSSGSGTDEPYDFAGYPWLVSYSFRDGYADGEWWVRSSDGGFEAEGKAGGQQASGSVSFKSGFNVNKGERLKFDARVRAYTGNSDEDSSSSAMVSIQNPDVPLASVSWGGSVGSTYKDVAVELYVGYGSDTSLIIINGINQSIPYSGSPVLYGAGSGYCDAGGICYGRINLNNVQVAVYDEDKDGIFIDDDDCPTVPGLNEFNGCPALESFDTDGDGIFDAEEHRWGLDPFVNDSYIDLDNDTLSSLDEARRGLNPLNPDTDNDTVRDDIDKCPRNWGQATDGCPEATTVTEKVYKEMYEYYPPAESTGFLVVEETETTTGMPIRQVVFLLLVALFIYLSQPVKPERRK